MPSRQRNLYRIRLGSAFLPIVVFRVQCQVSNPGPDKATGTLLRMIHSVANYPTLLAVSQLESPGAANVRRPTPSDVMTSGMSAFALVTSQVQPLHASSAANHLQGHPNDPDRPLAHASL